MSRSTFSFDYFDWSTIRRETINFFRAPFGLFYHAAWFTQPHHKEGFISFLDTIVAMDDVWIVTNWQAIQWVRNPTPLPLLHTFEPFGCNYPVRRYIYICIFFSVRNKTRFDLSSNFRSIGSAEEVQQSEGVQSMAQERGEVHEDLSNVSGHLSVDGQDRDTKQSHRQRRRCARMRGESGGKEGSVFRAIEVHPAGVKRSSANRGGDRDIFHSDSIQIPPLISLFTSAKRNVYPARVRQRNRKKER